MDFINDAIIADPDPKRILNASQLPTADRIGAGGQRLDGGEHFGNNGTVKASQFPNRG